MVFCPVQVQGDSAAGQIADAIRRFNAGPYADALIVGRGGGSIEELWAFNEEQVARAVFDSKYRSSRRWGMKPTLPSAILWPICGHPQPSAAAELAVPDTFEQKTLLSSLNNRMGKAVSSSIDALRRELERLKSSPGLSSLVGSVKITGFG